MNLQVRIYKGEGAPETFIFVEISEDLERVPEDLLQKMGTMEMVMELDLDPARRLVRVTGNVVIGAIHTQGYYLQLPPSPQSRSRRDNLHERFTT